MMDKGFSLRKSKVTNVVEYPYSSANIRRKQSCNNNKIQVSDWCQLLQEIDKVTKKVKKLCTKEKKETKSKSKSRTQNKSVYKQIGNKNQIFNGMQKKNNNYIRIQNMQANDVEICNPNCHSLIYECIKLNKENRKLQDQKQHLQKRLYYQSKQKRQLRWKLQKQKQRIMQCKQQTNNNRSFTLRLSKSGLYTNEPKYELSQSSYVTAKKTSPLKQISTNVLKIKPVLLQSKQDDSLLIDFSVPDTQKNVTRSDKDVQCITFEKDLYQLLQACKNESDPYKKKILRKQMKQIAQQIKNLKY